MKIDWIALIITILFFWGLWCSACRGGIFSILFGDKPEEPK